MARAQQLSRTVRVNAGIHLLEYTGALKDLAKDPKAVERYPNRKICGPHNPALGSFPDGPVASMHARDRRCAA